MSTIVFALHPLYLNIHNTITVVPDESVPANTLVIRTDTHEAICDLVKGTIRKIERPVFEPIDEDDKDDHYTWEQFVQMVDSGAIIDDDGFGDLATATQKATNIHISPSGLRRDKKPPREWATHVVWYNR